VDVGTSGAIVGPTLNLAMYLNVALAVRNCEFAEIMVPQNISAWVCPTRALPVIDGEGFIPAPRKPGLGYAIDRDKVGNLTIQRF
jgi:L-alanine-DL-glutamate epimerase-like enolase superfamily enzyme